MGTAYWSCGSFSGGQVAHLDVSLAITLDLSEGVSGNIYLLTTPRERFGRKSRAPSESPADKGARRTLPFRPRNRLALSVAMPREKDPALSAKEPLAKRCHTKYSIGGRGSVGYWSCGSSFGCLQNS